MGAVSQLAVSRPRVRPSAHKRIQVAKQNAEGTRRSEPVGQKIATVGVFFCANVYFPVWTGRSSVRFRGVFTVAIFETWSKGNGVVPHRRNPISFIHHFLCSRKEIVGVNRLCATPASHFPPIDQKKNTKETQKSSKQFPTK